MTLLLMMICHSRTTMVERPHLVMLKDKKNRIKLVTLMFHMTKIIGPLKNALSILLSMNSRSVCLTVYLNG